MCVVNHECDRRSETSLNHVDVKLSQYVKTSFWKADTLRTPRTLGVVQSLIVHKLHIIHIFYVGINHCTTIYTRRIARTLWESTANCTLVFNSQSTQALAVKTWGKWFVIKLLCVNESEFVLIHWPARQKEPIFWVFKKMLYRKVSYIDEFYYQLNFLHSIP